MLEKVNKPSDIKGFSQEELKELAKDMRTALMQKLSKRGGHFGPNFGMVEAIIAMHYVFDSPNDKFVFDVSHQAYCHKMLTGRKEAFLDEEHYYDVSGYTNPAESEHDFFNVGHTSTSVSLASGLAKARDLLQKKENIIAVIGDGSLSGGEALEGLDFAAELQSNLIIIVNDNEMSIAENHGGLYQNLKALRESNGTCSNNLFKAMGLDYIYQECGNDIAAMIETLQKVKDIDHPIVVHIHTKKGKGYKVAEENKEDWHYCAPFDKESGKQFSYNEEEDYEVLTNHYLLNKMKQDPAVVAVVAAVPTNIGFTEEKRKLAGKQFVDVGIAEEHAVTFACGLAAGGFHPFFAVYSSFLQRGYDQILHDMCMQNLPVTLMLDRAGLVGNDGETHQGVFDLSYLTMIPNMTVFAPKNRYEFQDAIAFAADFEAPMAIRYPKTDAVRVLKEYREPIKLGKSEWIRRGSRVALLAIGTMVETAMEVEELLAKDGIDATVVNLRFAKPLDYEMLDEVLDYHSLIVTMEENVLSGGVGEHICRYVELHSTGVRVIACGIPDKFIHQGSIKELLEEIGLDAQSIYQKISTML